MFSLSFARYKLSSLILKKDNMSYTFRNHSFEFTLAILKPHVVKATHALQGIHKLIVENEFLIVKTSRIRLSVDQTEEFYQEHKKKFFYNRLMSSMMSGECEVSILAKNNAIKDWRTLMGPTKVYEAVYSHPNSIRGTYGLTDTRNATHGSDSVASASREIGVIFPDFDINLWLEENKNKFNKEPTSDKTPVCLFPRTNGFSENSSYS